MARFAQATQVASGKSGSGRLDGCSGVRRNRLFHSMPTTLGSVGPLHAYAGGWMGHRARLLCSGETRKLSLARPSTKQSHRNEPVVDDAGRCSFRCYRRLRIGSSDSAPRRLAVARRDLFLRGCDLLSLGEWCRLRRHGKYAALRIQRVRLDRAGVFEFSASISHAANMGAGIRDSGSSVGQRCRAVRTGLVRLEFHSGALGRVAET